MSLDSGDDVGGVFAHLRRDVSLVRQARQRFTGETGAEVGLEEREEGEAARGKPGAGAHGAARGGRHRRQ
jgi:hypothetical protein